MLIAEPFVVNTSAAARCFDGRGRPRIDTVTVATIRRDLHNLPFRASNASGLLQGTVALAACFRVRSSSVRYIVIQGARSGSTGSNLPAGQALSLVKVCSNSASTR